MAIEVSYEEVDNPAVAAIQGDPMKALYDGAGRPIISFRQYQELSKTDQRLDNMMMRLVNPVSGQMKLFSAGKYHKWWGQGWRPLEMWRERPNTFAKDLPTAPVLFKCNVKYTDCPRFFDSERGLHRHWTLDHEVRAKKEAKKAGKVSSGSLIEES